MLTDYNYRRMVIVMIIDIIISLAGFGIQTYRLNKTNQEYHMREVNRNNYYNNNYTINAELYAVKPDGTEIVQDSSGKLWEIQGLKVGTHDKLKLDIKNNEVVDVLVVSWEKTW